MIFFPRIIFFLIVFFLIIFIIKSLFVMLKVPFYDFDEAHRAEKAKRMHQYQSLVPVTGSLFDRNDDFKFPYRTDPIFYMYYHLERPPLVYWLMIVSVQIFGNSELAYRLPSFLLGMGILISFYIFSLKFFKSGKEKFLALSVGLIALMTSKDLWLSSQYAQLDTGISFFLFIALIFLIFFCQKPKERYLFVSAASFSLAILSKGQPAIIFLIPLVFLFLIKKIDFKNLAHFVFYSLIILLPYLIYLDFKFGIESVIKIFSSFAFTSAIVPYSHIEAPFFWYARWWLESLRPGWILFLSLVALDLIKLKFNWVKMTLLVFIFISLLFFSYWSNKIWWYVLPLIPAIAFYIYLSCYDYLKENSQRILNLSLVIFMASLPIFMDASNKVAAFYGGTLLLFSTWVLNTKIFHPVGELRLHLVFLLAVSFSLLVFYLHFPKITPFHYYVKEAGQFYQNLPPPKCLWAVDMPMEAALFYSDAGHMEILTESIVISSTSYKVCRNNYLMTPSDIKDKIHLPQGELIFHRGTMKLYKLENIF